MGVIQAMLKMWPATPYLGLGIWLAWSFLAFSGGVWLSDIESSGENISKLFITTSVTFAIVAFVAVLNSSIVNKLLLRRSFLLVSGLLGAIGSLLIVLSGPYYIGAWLSVDALPIFITGGILAGISMCVLLLKCGMIYSVLTPRRVLLYSALSHLLLACIYYIVLGIPSWHPLPGGPPISGIIALIVVLPLASLVLSLADNAISASNALSAATDADHLDIEPEFMPVAIHKLPFAFWKFLIMLLFFATVIFMMRGVVVELHAVKTTLDASSLIMFLRILMAIVFVSLSLGVGSRRINFGKIYSLIAVVLVVIIAVLPILGVLDANWNLVISGAIMLFEFMLWCLLAFVSYQRATSPLIVMGFGYGIYMIGNTGGWLLGASGLPRIIEGSLASIFYLGIAGVVLVLAFLLFSERDFERLFSPLDRSGQSFNELMQEDIACGIASEDHKKTSYFYVEKETCLDATTNDSQGDFGATRDTLEDTSDNTSQTNHPRERRRRFSEQLDELASTYFLSKREAEVLRFLAMGRSSDFIAEQLVISWNTARSHVHNVYVKLGVHSRQELIDLVDSLKMN
jgi:DNA-binding CsgD family transcriptional regulator